MEERGSGQAELADALFVFFLKLGADARQFVGSSREAPGRFEAWAVLRDSLEIGFDGAQALAGVVLGGAEGRLDAPCDSLLNGCREGPCQFLGELRRSSQVPASAASP